VGSTDLDRGGGVLSATVVAQAGKVRIGKLDLDDLSYDGVYAGPVLHVLPGETMRLLLVNHGPQPAVRDWSCRDAGYLTCPRFAMLVVGGDVGR
jgi:hypothetical protein